MYTVLRIAARPVHLYCGSRTSAAAPVTPRAWGRYLAAILDSRATFYPDQEHYLWYKHWDETLWALVA
jgi:hypothetical protein